MNQLQDIIHHIPHGSLQDTAIRLSGIIGGGTFLSGFVLDPTWLTATGQFMGGLAALLTIGYTIYKGRRNGK